MTVVKKKKEEPKIEENDEPYVHDATFRHHNRTGHDVEEMEQTGSQFCKLEGKQSTCVLWKQEKGGYCLANLLDDIMEKPCSRIGACKREGECIQACKWYMCYHITADLLGYLDQQSLPICVRLYINDHYGESKVGYQEKNE